jgi:hypothetical protein
VHYRSKGKTILSGGCSLKVPAFIKIKLLEVLEETRSWQSSQTALLWPLIWSA